MTLIAMFEYLASMTRNTVKIGNGKTVHIGEAEPDRIKVEVQDKDNLPVKSYCFTTQYVIEQPKDLSDESIRQTRSNAEMLIREIQEYY